MKLTAFFLLTVALLMCHSALPQRVTISGKNIELEQVFTEIKKQTGFEFLYESTLLKSARPVTLDIEKMPVEEVLKICLEGQGLGFNIRSGTIIIFKQDDPAWREQPGIDKAATDTVTLIKGRVVDTRGLPVQMASIVLMRTSAGTLTDKEGAFALKVQDLQITDKVNISFIGMSEQMVRLNGKTNLGQIVLPPAEQVLEETVIIAYGTTSERFRTGDITTIKAADIEKTPALNVLEALAGRVPGLYVRQDGSNPGSVFNIQLRGVNVIPQTAELVRSGNAVNMLSKPLIVIDGLPMPPDVLTGAGVNLGVDAIPGLSGAAGGQDALYWLNPLDVERVTVLKDAEATALYGSRAANGVIMITTKKGKAGKTSLGITVNTGINASARRLKLLNTQQYLAMRHEAWNNTTRAGLSVVSPYDVSKIPTVYNAYDLLLWDTTRNTGWQKELLGSAPVYNINLELSGGEGRTAYRIATGYNRSKTSYPNKPGNPAFREEKGTLTLNLSTRSENNRFRLVTSLLSSLTGSLQPGSNPDNNIWLVPHAPAIFDKAGNLNFAEWRPVDPRPQIFSPHPLYYLAAPFQSNRFTMMARTSLKYELLPSLTLTVDAGYSRTDAKLSKKTPGASVDPIVLAFMRVASFGKSTGTGFNVEPNVRYTISRPRHYLELMAGASYQSDKQEGDYVTASGYTADELMGSPVAATSQTYSYNIVQRRSVSALGRITYRYDDALLVDLSARRDGSSSFGPGRRYGNFGSVGVGWIFTQASWSKHIPWLTFGKIRGSYGITGSQNADPYAYQPAYMPMPNYAIFLPNYNPWYVGNGTYQGLPAYTLRRIANATLNWVQAVSYDLGIDLYFLPGQRLRFTAQWYGKRTGNQLVTNAVSAVTGVTSFFTNLPAKVENSGVEAILDYTSPQRPAGWEWLVQVNIAVNSNRLVAFPGLENSPLNSYYTIGQSISWRQVYPSVLDKTLGVYRAADPNNLAPYKVNNYPVFTGGMQLGISWKGISLSVAGTFARQKGFTSIPAGDQPGALTNFGRSNQPASVIKNRHWQSPADNDLGGGLYAARIGSTPLLDVYWGDVSYIAVKNATLSYAWPPAFLKKAGIGALSFYTRADNLLLLPLLAYNGVNPEQPGLLSPLPLRMILVGGFTINL